MAFQVVPVFDPLSREALQLWPRGESVRAKTTSATWWGQLADVAAQVVVAMQANAPPGRLAQELEAGGEFQCVVHQASGMVAAQLEVSVGQALIRLRADAFGNHRPPD